METGEGGELRETGLFSSLTHLLIYPLTQFSTSEGTEADMNPSSSSSSSEDMTGPICITQLPRGLQAMTNASHMCSDPS